MITVGDAFAPLRTALECAGVRYAVGGSWASSAFGEPRFTNDVDIVADFTPGNLEQFVQALPPSYFLDPDEARKALRLGTSFNVVFMPIVVKFDFFPASSFPWGNEELNGAISLDSSELSETPAPFVAPEDILLVKLRWFQDGGEVSETQWRDILGIIRTRGPQLNRSYLEQSALKLGVHSLLERAFQISGH